MKFSIIFSFVLLSTVDATCSGSSKGIFASSTGGCTNKSSARCTSYEGILCGSVDGLIKLKEVCRCTITVIGGTEVGHQGGGHGERYKVDPRHNQALNTFIKNQFKRNKNRADGSPQWEFLGGNIYTDEVVKNRWSVMCLGIKKLCKWEKQRE
ncbi:hypothetical protein RSAG8_06979, partial [Rhizoctonia solani AG-8 WAC10335]